MKSKAIFFIINIMLLCCCSNNDNIVQIVHRLKGKPIQFPDKIVFFKNALDTVDYNIRTKNKILVYYDSVGCMSCKLKFREWKDFIDEVNLYTNDFALIFVVNPKKHSDIYTMRTKIRDGNFNYPICVDLNDEINKLNHFPDDDRFRCFLLDENNRVVLIGNPVRNPKIKDLYIRTICEKLNINYSPKAENTPRKNLGVFSKNETKTVQFEIKNSDQKTLKIDSVFTSCECTKAEIDKMEILQNESAVMSVTYKPDGIGDFVREIYVKIHDEEKPKIFEIEGKVN